MTNSMQHPNSPDAGGATKIALPTFHPDWCDVEIHQSARDDYDNPDPGEVARHFATAGHGNLLELRWGSDRVIRDGDTSWNISLQQQPLEGDPTGATGWPFICLFTRTPGAGQCVLTISSGEARVLAAQLVAAADKVDLA